MATSAATAPVRAEGAANTPATGAPTISGTVQVGKTLTASISSIEDVDGLENAVFRYRWIRSDGDTDMDIAGATGSTYTLLAADEGKVIKVGVTFTDDGGTEETLVSLATAAVSVALIATFENVPDEADESGGLDLALRGDAFLVETESEAAANTVATKADASRLRLILESSWSLETGGGGLLTPGLDLGLRHDGGDAETGTGVELGGSLRYADPGSGFSIEASCPHAAGP